MDVLTVVILSTTSLTTIIIITIIVTTHPASVHMNFVIIIGTIIFRVTMGGCILVLSQIAVSCYLDAHVNESNVHILRMYVELLSDVRCC